MLQVFSILLMEEDEMKCVKEFVCITSFYGQDMEAKMAQANAHSRSTSFKWDTWLPSTAPNLLVASPQH